MAHETGGQAFTHEDLVDGFTQVLKDIICTTQNKAIDEDVIIDVEAISVESPDTEAERVTEASSPLPETAALEADAVDTETGNSPAQIVRNHALIAAGIGLIPLPLADLAVIGATQLLMIRKLSQHYDLPFSQHRATAFISALIGAGETGLIFTSVGKWIPGIGTIGLSVTTAAAAGGLTYAIGKVFVRHFDMGGTFLDLDANAMKDYFAEQYKEGKLILK